MIREWLAVAVGGLIGTLIRYSMASLFSLAGPLWLPLSTLLVNVVGCFAIGYLAEWSLTQQTQNQWWVVALRAGVLGGLTTFSSFGLDIVRLWQTERPEAAVGLASAHIVLGLAAVVVGMQVARS